MKKTFDSNEVRALIPGISEFSFAVAISAMRAGWRITRKGWNGKNMWVCRGDGQTLEPGAFWNPHTRKFAEQRLEKRGLKTEVLPYFIMKTADDKVLMGWLASQSDLDADDWMLVPEHV